MKSQNCLLPPRIRDQDKQGLAGMTWGTEGFRSDLWTPEGGVGSGAVQPEKHEGVRQRPENEDRFSDLSHGQQVRTIGA